MKEIIGADLKAFNTPGALGVVTDTRYIMCIWPRLDAPMALFAEGSKGIEVQGPPTPRNVVFPADTVALNILVNDAAINEPARWRLTDIPTKMDCYFTTAHEEQQVEVEMAQTKTVEVETGIFAEVEYTKPGTELQTVAVKTDLTVKEAIAMAATAKAETPIEAVPIEAKP